MRARQKRLGLLQPGGFKFHHRKGQSPSIGGGNERPGSLRNCEPLGEIVVDRTRRLARVLIRVKRERPTAHVTER